MAKKEKKEKEAKKQFSKAPASTADKQAEKETTTVHVSEGKRGKAFPVRLVLIYVLLLAGGLFIGIVLRLAFR